MNTFQLENNLRLFRRRKEVAAKLEVMGLSVSREMLSQMELGHYSIRVSVLLALKQIYNATFDDFFKDLETK